MADPRRGNQLGHAVHHAQTGAQNGHNAHLLAAEVPGLGLAKGSFDLHFLGRQVTGDLVHHQHADFFQQFPEFLGAGVNIAHQAQLVLNQRMIEDVYLPHGKASFVLALA